MLTLEEQELVYQLQILLSKKTLDKVDVVDIKKGLEKFNFLDLKTNDFIKFYY